MNTYRIHQKIKTPAHLFDREITCGSYAISPFSKKGFHGGALLIKKDEPATNWKEAYGRFSEGLNPILDAISVVTQCAVLSTAFGSFFIYRARENERAIFFYHARDTETVGMPRALIEKYNTETPFEEFKLGSILQEIECKNRASNYSPSGVPELPHDDPRHSQESFPSCTQT